MNSYTPDLFFQELGHCAKIDEPLLARSQLPTLTAHDQQLTVERRDQNNNKVNSIITHEGMVKTAYYVNKAIHDDEFCTHVREILASEIDGREIQVKRQWIWGAHSFTPHVDGNGRDYFFIYLLDTGGDNVISEWFIEPGHELVRKWDPVSLWHVADTRSLQLVFDVVLKPKTWYYLTANILHSVSNITGMRSAITARFLP
jgi:hypothetical protein